MRAIVLEEEKYKIKDVDKPRVSPENVLIRVAFAGVNRADLYQKQGKYPLPSNTPPIPGMEVSGLVEAVGANIRNFKPGAPVCALLSEGAFSEYVSVQSSLVFPIPEGLMLEQAAALPEACFTSWISLMRHGRLRPGETVLIHGGASGIGIIAIQVAKFLGARVFTTAGSPEKCAACMQAGAERAINYKKEDYVEVIQEITEGKGVNIVMDMVGGDYFGRNLEALAYNGRMSIIAFIKGSKVNANISPILLKHLSVHGSTLRSRPLFEKAQIAEELRVRLWNKFEKSSIKPMIHGIFSLSDAEKALELMEEGLNIGKILIRM